MDIQWPLAIFTLLTGAGGWLFAFVAADEVRGGSRRDGFVPGLVALVLVIVGGLASVLHLSHPDRIMNALSHPASGIFVEAALCGCLVACIAIYLICSKRGVRGGAKTFAVLGAAFGILISFMAGHSYLMAAREAWNTLLLPAAYLGTSVPMGAALYWLLTCSDDESSPSFAALATAVGGALAGATLAMYGAVVGAFGGETLVYLAASLCCSIVVVVIGVLGRGKVGRLYACVAVAAAVVAGLLFRMMMWVVGSGVYNFFD